MKQQRYCMELTAAVMTLAVSLLAGDSVDSAEVPESLQRGLENVSDLANPISIKWSRGRVSSLPKDVLLRRLGLDVHDDAFLKPAEVQYAHDDGRAYSRSVEPTSRFDQDGKLTGTVMEVLSFAFDGNVVYNWSGESRGIAKTILFRDTRISLLKNNAPMADLFRASLFEYLGVRVPNLVGDLGIARGDTSIVANDRSSIVEVSERAGLWEVHLDDTQTGDRHIYWIDPHWKFLAVRYEHRPKDHQSPDIRAVASDYREISGSAFGFPRNLSVAFVDAGGEELYRDEYKVLEVNKNPIPDSRFVIVDLRPGVKVADGTLPEAGSLPGGRLEYVIPAKADDLDKTIDAARRGERYNPLVEPRRQGTTAWHKALFVANVVVITAVAALLFWRRRHRH